MTLGPQSDFKMSPYSTYEVFSSTAPSNDNVVQYILDDKYATPVKAVHEALIHWYNEVYLEFFSGREENDVDREAHDVIKVFRQCRDEEKASA